MSDINIEEANIPNEPSRAAGMAQVVEHLPK
jgi:hypothetical protein